MTETHGPAVEGTLHSLDGMGVVRMRSRYDTDIRDLWSALTEPQRLAHWYARVEGDLCIGGEFTATVFASGWDGRGRIEACVPPHKLEVTMTENSGDVGVVTAELFADGDTTILVIERRGVPLDLLWAYGAGWHTHLEDLAAHLAGHERAEGEARFDELAPSYREKTVVRLDH